MAAMSSGNWEEARGLLEKAVAASPQDGELLNDLGLVLLRSGDGAGAFARWYAALEADGNTTAARLNLARFLAQGGFGEDARRHVRVVLNTEPGNDDALQLAAVLWNGAGDEEELAIFHRKSWESNKTDGRRRLAYARTLAAAGKPAAAIAEFRELVSDAALGAEAWHGIGMVWMDQGGALEASFAFREACKLNDGSMEYRLDLVRALMAGNTVALKLEAEKLILALLEQQPDHAELHFLAGCLYDDAGGDDLAIEHYVEALVNGCTHARLPLYLARVYARQGRLEKATPLFRAVAERAPDGSGEHAEAMAFLQNGVRP